MVTDDPSARRGEPPALLDPRRTGSLIGLAGAVTFAFSYSSALPGPVGTAARVVTVVGVVATLWALFVRPRPLGPFVPPRPGRVVAYLLCVAGELALIAVGSRMLEAAGSADLRPALIAAVVGLHFVPFAWAFGERMFVLLGTTLLVLGGAGLLLGTGVAASGAAVAAGVAMAGILFAYGLGAFAPRRSGEQG